jgi:hypothetical protein
MTPDIQKAKSPLRDNWSETRSVQGGPHDPGPPWNLLDSLQVSLRWSYGSLKAGFQKSICTRLAKRGRPVEEPEGFLLADQPNDWFGRRLYVELW